MNKRQRKKWFKKYLMVRLNLLKIVNDAIVAAMKRQQILSSRYEEGGIVVHTDSQERMCLTINGTDEVR